MTETDQPAPPETVVPSLVFKSVQFSDQTRIVLGPSDIVVLVGPNNAGKSAALRELSDARGIAGHVIKEAPVVGTGSAKDLRSFLQTRGVVRNNGAEVRYGGLGYDVGNHELKQWETNKRQLFGVFLKAVQTQNRITESNQVGPYDAINGNPGSPIQVLFSDRKLEQRISGYFTRAFKKELIFVDGGSSWPLHVGTRPAFAADEVRTDSTYFKKLQELTEPLVAQGDGMRSFVSVVLGTLMSDIATILILDEPEAFLHPPQARLLGEFIARERPKQSQLFVATHSADVLLGLLNAAPTHLRVLRIQRDGEINRVKELDQTKAKEISSDPLMKYSSVLAGVFHERVVICEADSDCMFYGALLDLPVVHGEHQPDVLFVHGNGKHRACKLASALRALDVPTDAIVDVDILNDLEIFERLVEALGGDWSAIERDATQLKKDIESHKPWLNSGEVVKGIRDILDAVPVLTGEFPKQSKEKVVAVFKKASPWDAIKEAGETAIPSGEPTKRWKRLSLACSQFGLWLVPVGQLEGFDKDYNMHGPKWVQAVLESRDLATSRELASARQFVRSVWKRDIGFQNEESLARDPAEPSLDA